MFLDSKSRVLRENFIIDTDFGVIHEDESILILNKPSPLAVHPVGVYAQLNLHSILKNDLRWKDIPIHFAHRVDAETSGVICATKNHEAARFIGIEFLKSRVKKKYHALVFGNPKAPEGTIDLPLGLDKSSGFQTVRVVDHENGEAAKTSYRVLWTNGGYSYLEITPETGRTHQIRAHLSFIRHPIVGDKIYIDVEIFKRYVLNGLDAPMLEQIKLPRLALHATSLTFAHPGHKQEVTFQCDAPDFFKEVQC